eukprot:NODE_1508_length_1123_cov_450.688202.p2 GENE.NODE_1508_length_1123_cov_450.688202~~NODE_1508_length_1123_cov_450.688202.p2  ORF type:complete len:286 (+),score=50.79 NODE_1508_length_1123_cov_450.688202:46-903(+)
MCSVLGRVLCCCFNPKICQSGEGQACLDIGVHVLGLATAAAVIVAAYFEGLDFSSSFTWHVVCMAIAMPLLMVAGRWINQSDRVYHDFDDAVPDKGKFTWKGFSTAEGGKGRGAEDDSSKWTRRNSHGNLMILATLCIIAGYLCIFISHWSTKNYFGYEFSTDTWQSVQRIVHAWTGYVVILLIFQQVLVGFCKYTGLAKGVRILTCHGGLGRFTLGLGCINVILGMIAIGWDTWVIVVIGILAFVMAWFGCIYPLPYRGFYLGQPAPLEIDTEKAPNYGTAAPA